MAVSTKIGLDRLPPIFILPTNLPADDMHDAENAVSEAQGHLTFSPGEARIFLGQLSQKRRAAFELRSRGVWTEESILPSQHESKKRKLDAQDRPTSSGSTTASEDGQTRHASATKFSDAKQRLASLSDHVVVLKLTWLHKCLETGVLQSPEPYLVYTGLIIEKPAQEALSSSPPSQVTYIKATPDDASAQNASQASQTQALDNSTLNSVLDQAKSTSKHDLLAHGGDVSTLPPPPAWMLEPHSRPNYACLRSSYASPPNQEFLKHLHKIKEARLLTLDEIGVRAYSTSIASLSAYNRKITNPAEITRLPGCSDKIAALWVEWYTSADPDAPDSERHLAVTDALAQDEDLNYLKIFYEIWGVGADTARKFYFEYGWKDLDDVVEFGWHSGQLNRVQQIGVKFYDEFMDKIPRKEVEEIADVVLRHARLCRDIPQRCWSNKKNAYRGNWTKPDDGRADPAWDPRDMVCVIVGGYRRGKLESGDVDVILSHRDESVTKDLVVDVVKSLENEGYITHTLTLHTSNSDRDQQTLPYRSAPHTGHGFDTLDKALCVWQDPEFDRDKHEKNPNVHRRVDIIISPWRTVGAAVLGWSGATTFERDIRRWCRKEKGWKFDSSGVRDRGNGAVLDFESPKPGVRNGKQREGEVVDDGDGWEDRERRLMEGLGIGWRPAVERFTG